MHGGPALEPSPIGACAFGEGLLGYAIYLHLFTYPLNPWCLTLSVAAFVPLFDKRRTRACLYLYATNVVLCVCVGWLVMCVCVIRLPPLRRVISHGRHFSQGFIIALKNYSLMDIILNVVCCSL